MQTHNLFIESKFKESQDHIEELNSKIYKLTSLNELL